MASPPPAVSPWSSASRIAGANRWERESAEMGRGATEAIVELAQPAPGMRVLDVASGTGAPALQLARRVAPGGHVTGVDIAPEPLKVAAERAQERNLSNISFEPADVHNLPFADDSYDLVTCRLGVMFFSDLPRSLAEMRRVLRPNGRVALLAWGPFEQPYFDCTAALLMRHTGAALPETAKQTFKFAPAGTLATALTEAGFRDVFEELKEVPWVWPGPVEGLWGYFQAATIPFRPLVEQIRPAQREAIRSVVCAALSRYWDGTKVNLTAKFVLAAAIK